MAWHDSVNRVKRIIFKPKQHKKQIFLTVAILRTEIMRVVVRGKEIKPYVFGDDLLGGVGEVEVDEIWEQRHGCVWEENTREKNTLINQCCLGKTIIKTSLSVYRAIFVYLFIIVFRYLRWSIHDSSKLVISLLLCDTNIYLLEF